MYRHRNVLFIVLIHEDPCQAHSFADSKWKKKTISSVCFALYKC